MSAIRQNSSSPASPHVAFVVILAFIAILKGLGNNPPFGIDSIKRWNGCALSESCLKSTPVSKRKRKKKKTNKISSLMISFIKINDAQKNEKFHCF